MAHVDPLMFRFLTAIGIGLLGWVGLNTHTTAIELGKITVRLEAQDSRIRQQEDRAINLSSRIRKLEGHHTKPRRKQK